MEETVNIVGWIMTGIAILFVLVGYFRGRRRGLKKSLFRFLWVLATAVILIFVTQYITKGILNMDLSFLNLSYLGQKYSSLGKYATALIENNTAVQSYFTNTEVLSSLAINVVLLVANLVIFVLLFWLARFLLWPFWALFARKINKKAKELKKQGYKKEAKKILKPGWGGVFGILLGFVIVLATFMPIIGLNNMIVKIENKNSENESGLITEFLQDMSPEPLPWLGVYSESPVGKAFEVLGINCLGNIVFDKLSTTKIDNVNISLSDEIVGIAKTGLKGYAISKIDFKNLTDADITLILDYSKDMIRQTFSSGIMNTLFDNLLPQTIDAILNDPTYKIKLESTGYPALDDGIKELMNAMKNIRAKDIGEDMVKIVEIFELMHEKGIILKAYNQDIQGVINIIKNVDNNLPLGAKTFAQRIADKTFDMKTVVTFSPILINTSVKLLCDITGATFEKNNNINTSLKTLFANFLQDSFDIVGNIDINNAPYVDLNDIAKIGKILDSVFDGSLMTQNTYDSLMAAAEIKLNELIDEGGLETDINDLLADAVSEVFDIINTSNFSFASDFSNIGNVAVKMWNFYNSGYENVETYDLEEIGSWVDTLMESDIIAALYDNGVNFGFKFLDSYLDTVGISVSDIDFIKTALIGLLDNTKTNEFQTEFAKYQNLFDAIVTAVKENKFEDRETYKNLGKLFDELVDADAVIMSGANLKKTIKLALNALPIPADIKTLEISVSGNSKNILTHLGDNIDNISSYEDEFEILGVFIEKYAAFTKNNPNVDFVDIQLATLGEWFDDLKISVLFGNLINPMIEHFIDQYAVDMSADFVDILNDVKLQLPNILSYKTELGYLGQIIDLMQTDNIDLSTAGGIIDNLKNSILIGGSLEEIVVSIIVPMFEDALPSELADLADTFEFNLKSMFAPDQSATFAVELGYLNSLISVVDDFDLKTAGAKLDSVKGSVLLKDVLEPLLKHAVKTEIDKIDDTDIKNNLQPIIINISKMFEPDQTATFATEFGYLSDLLSIVDDFKLETAGAKLDNVKDSVLLGGVLEPTLKDIISDEIAKIEDADIRADMQSIKDNISKMFESDQTATFATEFGYLNRLLNFDFEEATQDEIAEEFDALKSSVLVGDAIKAMFERMVNGALDEVDDARLDDILDLISDNIATFLAQVNTVGGNIYGQEIDYLQDFVDFADGEMNESTLNILQEKLLDDDGKSLSILINNEVLYRISNLLTPP